MKKKEYYFLRKVYVYFINIILFSVMIWQFQRMWISTFNDLLDRVFSQKGNLLMVLLYGIVVLFLFRLWGAFKIGYLKSANLILSQCLGIISANLFLGVQMTLMVAKLNETKNIIYHTLLLSMYDIVLCIPVTIICCKIYQQLFKPLRLLIVNGNHASEICKKVMSREDKYEIGNIIQEKDISNEEILAHMKDHDAVLLNGLTESGRKQMIQICYANSIRTYFKPEIMDVFVKGTSAINLFDTPLYMNENIGLSYGVLAVKRLFDIIFSVLFLIGVSPLLLVVAFLIKIEDGGPIFYKQKRCTMNGNTFNIYKFRSMIVGAEKDGQAIPAKDKDKRITKIGKFIRRFHIDEIPQFYNVLRGNMSVVGPRPERVEHVAKYSREIPEFGYRLKVRGGITGYAQVYGKYNTSPEDKLIMDLQYIVNYSFLLDLQIILETVKVLFKKDNTEGFHHEENKKV